MASFVTSKLLIALAAASATSLLHFMYSRNHFFFHRSDDTGIVGKSSLRNSVRTDEFIDSSFPRNEPSELAVDISLQKYTNEAQKDLVQFLPGLNFYYSSTFRQFSGYLTVDDERQRNIHYWYVESSRDPENDPVLLWTNGGPGCSGLLGFGTEFGPFYFEGDGTLSLNPQTWNSIANIIYIEQPAGVGFSYSMQPDMDYETGDERAKLDNFRVIQEFFKRFPERRKNEFYIGSESYGGHYIPQLALEILDKNTDGEINFRGFLVGNPYVDPFSNDVTMIQTYYLHGLFARPLFEKWQAVCTDLSTYDPIKCNQLVDAMIKEAGDMISPYALDYPKCTESGSNDYPPELFFPSAQETAISSTSRSLSSRSSQTLRLYNQRKGTRLENSPPFLPTEDTYHPCAEAHMFKYLNRDDVKKALHVRMDRNWTSCTDDVHYSQDDEMTPQINLYAELVSRAKVKGSNLKMLVFSGDDDSVCSTASTQYWIYDIGVSPKPEDLWKPWKFNKQTAGYVTKFDLGDGADSSFVFATVHGAGHEVPAYRPAEALELFKSFFSGQWDVDSSGTK